MTKHHSLTCKRCYLLCKFKVVGSAKHQAENMENVSFWEAHWLRSRTEGSPFLRLPSPNKIIDKIRKKETIEILGNPLDKLFLYSFLTSLYIYLWMTDKSCISGQTEFSFCHIVKTLRKDFHVSFNGSLNCCLCNNIVQEASQLVRNTAYNNREEPTKCYSCAMLLYFLKNNGSSFFNKYNNFIYKRENKQNIKKPGSGYGRCHLSPKLGPLLECFIWEVEFVTLK